MNKEYVLGIDIGGTNTACAIVDHDGKIIASGKFSSRGYKDGKQYVTALCDKLRELIASAGMEGRIVGIGVGAPCANYSTGEIESAADLPWARNTPLGRLIEEGMQLPTLVTNDANAAAVGEMTYGVARDMKNFIILTLGTGVGSGIVADGKVITGHRGFAGELGHIIVNEPEMRPCGCGRNGCLETYCSASGVARTAKQMLATEDTPSLLRDIDAEKLTSKDVYEAACKGDELARHVFEFTGRVLGAACANFACFSEPEAIVLFGGLAQAGDMLIKPLEKEMDSLMLSLYKGHVKILVSTLNEDGAAMLGASALGWEASRNDKRPSGFNYV